MNKRWFNACAYASLALLGVYISAYQNMADAISQEFQMNSTQMGLIVALHFLGSAVVPPIFGKLCDRGGARPLLIASAIMAAFGLLIMYVSKSAAFACIGIFLTGCGYAAMEGLYTSLLPLVNPGEGDRVINRSQMWFCVGAMLGPILSECGTAWAGDWRFNYGVMLVMYAVLAISTFAIKVDGRRGEACARGGGNIFMRPLLWALLIGIFLYVGLEQGVAFFMGKFFSGGGYASLSGVALSVYWLGMIVGRMLGGILRKNHVRVNIIGLLLALPVTGGIMFLGAGGATAALFGAMGFLIAITWPTLTALAEAKYESQGGTAVGYMMTAGAMGGAVFPVIMGALTDGFGVWTSFLLMPVLVVLVIVLLYGASKDWFRS